MSKLSVLIDSPCRRYSMPHNHIQTHMHTTSDSIRSFIVSSKTLIYACGMAVTHSAERSHICARKHATMPVPRSRLLCVTDWLDGDERQHAMVNRRRAALDADDHNGFCWSYDTHELGSFGGDEHANWPGRRAAPF